MTNKTSDSIDNLCSLLELSSKESLIYRKLLEYPAGVSVAILSDKIKIPRGTLYGILDGMVSRGTVQLSTNGGKQYRPTPLDELENFMKTKVTRAQDELELFKNSKQAFSKIIGKAQTHPKFTYNHGEAGLVQTYFSILQTEEKFIRAIFPEKNVLDKLGRATVLEFKKLRLGRGIKVKTLISMESLQEDSLLESSERNNMETKLLPLHLKFPASIFIFDSTVAFFTTGDETTSAKIESKAYSETMKSLFDTIWDNTKK